MIELIGRGKGNARHRLSGWGVSALLFGRSEARLECGGDTAFPARGLTAIRMQSIRCRAAKGGGPTRSGAGLRLCRRVASSRHQPKRCQAITLQEYPYLSVHGAHPLYRYRKGLVTFAVSGQNLSLDQDQEPVQLAS
jgi:hypothetical protein